MSWTKRTLRLSAIDDTVERLRAEHKPYKVTLLGRARGYGVNDLSRETEKWRVYNLRKLEYGTTVMMEQIIQSTDMHLDDFIVSHIFYKKEVPENWKFRINKC